MEDCKAAAERVIDWAGRIDVLINNAGLTQRRKVMEVSAADYDLVTDVVLRGTLYMSQAVIPQMRSQKDGSIICISSLSALQGGGVFGGDRKSVVEGKSVSVRVDLGGRRIIKKKNIQ